MATRRLSLPFDGARARRERERQGLTLADLTERCARVGMRINRSTLHRWETGEFGPTAPRLKVLARALDIEITELLTPIDEIKAECHS